MTETETRLHEAILKLEANMRRLAVGLGHLCDAVEEMRRRDAAVVDDLLREPERRTAPQNGRAR